MVKASVTTKKVQAFTNTNISLRRILNLRLPDQQEGISETDHRIYMSGLIDLNLESLVRATGALLQYLDETGVGSNGQGPMI
jgi:hypothetical protein